MIGQGVKIGNGVEVHYKKRARDKTTTTILNDVPRGAKLRFEYIHDARYGIAVRDPYR